MYGIHIERVNRVSGHGLISLEFRIWEEAKARVRRVANLKLSFPPSWVDQPLSLESEKEWIPTAFNTSVQLTISSTFTVFFAPCSNELVYCGGNISVEKSHHFEPNWRLWLTMKEKLQIFQL